MVSPALLLVLLAATAQDDGPEPPPELKPVAGHWGLTSISEVDLGEEHAKHQYVVYLAFPQRGRTDLTPVGGRPSQRRVTFRYGESTWMLAPGVAVSEVLEGAARAATLRELTLRRALLLWPHGFEWSGEGRERIAEWESVDGSPRLLRAELPAGGGRPTRIEVLGDEGQILDALADITWRTVQEKTSPATLTRIAGSRRVWEERITAVTSRRQSEKLFVPHDRRDATGQARLSVRAIEVPAETVRRVALEEGTELAAALVRADAEVARARKAHGEDAIDPAPTLELDPGGRPVAVRLVWRSEDEAPEGWEGLPDRSGLALHLPGVDRWGTAELVTLARAAAKAGKLEGGFFLRASPPDRTTRRAQLVLTLREPVPPGDGCPPGR